MSTKVTNWKTDPKAQAAKRIATEFGADIAIVLTITDAGIEMFSYGTTGKLSIGGSLGAAFDGLMAYLSDE